MRCLTEQIYVDDLEADEDSIAESVMDENSISQISRPGTSLRTSLNSSNQLLTPNSSQSIRPVTQSGRPITGILRPGILSKNNLCSDIFADKILFFKLIQVHNLVVQLV